MIKREAEQKIRSILAQIEMQTNHYVQAVNIIEIDARGMVSNDIDIAQDVEIVLVRRPGSCWMEN